MKHCVLVFVALLLPQSLWSQPTAPDAFIAEYAKEHNFNGSILVQKGGSTTYAKSFGLANRSFQVPNTNQTRYWIASITKLFTAALILGLHEQGKVDLQKTIGTYLPDYSGEGAGKVTLHQLLNHTSGLANFDTVKDIETALKSGIPNYQTPYTSDQLLAKYCSGKLVSTPGKVFDYNNADYIILGKIVERVYGKPYEQVLRERILQPLKLESTGMLHQSDIVVGLADTYFFRDDLKALVNDLPVYPENWSATPGRRTSTSLSPRSARELSPLRPGDLHVSWSNTSLGSVCAARMAGNAAEMRATEATRSAAVAKTKGSVDSTSNRSEAMKRPAPNAAAAPIAMPIPVRRIACATTMPSTSPRRAPSAIRTPISCARCATP